MSITQNEWAKLDDDKKCLICAIINLLNAKDVKPIVEHNRAYIAIWLHSFICIRVFENDKSFPIKSYQAGRELDDISVRRWPYKNDVTAYYQRDEYLVYLVSRTCDKVSAEIIKTINTCDADE